MSAQSKVQAILDASTGAKNGPAGIVFGAINHKGEFITQAASGKTEIGSENEMKIDSVFPIFSCTKMITGMAVMSLVEQGKLDLDAPVDALLPEVAAAKIIDINGNLTDAKTKITLRMLLAHTSGLSYSFFSEAIKAWGAEKGDIEFEGIEANFHQSLIVEPGTQFNYSVGIDWAGIAVARTTGMTLGEYCKKVIFDPLGLKDTAFTVLPHCKDRLVSSHQRLEDGTIVKKPHFPMASLEHSFNSGGGGAYSTNSEYLKIVNVLINEGKGANGVQILKPETVLDMFKDQLTPEHVPNMCKDPLDQPIAVAIPSLSYGPVEMMPGIKKGWGLTFLITEDPLPTGRSAGSVWWAGIANLYWQADPVKKTANFIMSQSLPFNDPAILGPWMECEAVAYSELK